MGTAVALLKLAVNQRHFTKYVISGEFGYRPVADLDSHITALDNEKLVTRFALPKNNAAGPNTSRLDVVPGQDAEVRIERHCNLPDSEN